MPKLSQFRYVTWDGQDKTLDFLGETSSNQRFHTTILTGHNGSHKSTILRQLVGALAISDQHEALTLEGRASFPINVICASGSVADRFPAKENAGRFTEYSVPEYVYLGQRVGGNLLSKKRSLETAMAFALDGSLRHRFQWPFFSHACELAGIRPWLDLTFSLKPSAKREGDLLGAIQAVASGKDQRRPQSRSRAMSPAVAAYLLEQFTYDEFNELEYFIKGRAGTRLKAVVGTSGPEAIKPVSLGAIRLALLADLVALDEVRVWSRAGGDLQFSAYELSSGEYHMLTTLMGLGFAVPPEAVILIDEPENSLHPQWQQEFMEALLEICDSMRDGHLIISTHSPLIVSSARPGSTVVDMTSLPGMSGLGTSLVCESADTVLFEKFGIASSRNRHAIDIVQRAVELVERGLAETPSFKGMEDDLKSVQARLRDGDPLADVIEALLEQGS